MVLCIFYCLLYYFYRDVIQILEGHNCFIYIGYLPFRFCNKLQIAFSDEEKKMVEEVFNNAIDCLSDEDKKLPQVSED